MRANKPDEEKLGHYFSIIDNQYIQTDVEPNSNDLFWSEGKSFGLIYTEKGFKLFTNNPQHYVLEEDLEGLWKLYVIVDKTTEK